MSTIVSRQIIARQAATAAEFHAKKPMGSPLPPNPYCGHTEPEHHREWLASFWRALLAQLCPDCEGCA